MATAALSPTATPDGRQDSVTIGEFCALLVPTGYHVPESTMRRWAKQAGLTSVKGWYSDSELLELHARHMLGD
jgi:hypothetical protein